MAEFDPINGLNTGKKPQKKSKNERLQTATKLKKDDPSMPVFYPDLEAYQMNMHTTSCETYSFILTGAYLYSPNKSSRCGYGSDDWFFLCKCNGEDYILHFSDDAGYGTMWDSVVVSKEDAQQLHNLPDTEWGKLCWKSKRKTLNLHPDTIDSAKEIVKSTHSRTGLLSDNAFYGQ